jgi:hypothetical protein
MVLGFSEWLISQHREARRNYFSTRRISSKESFSIFDARQGGPLMNLRYAHAALTSYFVLQQQNLSMAMILPVPVPKQKHLKLTAG